MKTAEEWCVEREQSPIEGTLAESRASFLKMVKQIQLDAMKEGMRRAAEIANASRIGKYKSDNCEIHRTDTKQAILTASEQLTEKDL